MRKVITYGTFDLFHEGHINLLKRAREYGDYLIVGVTTESYDDSRGKLNVQENLMKRIENVRKSGFADEIIIEEYEGQKIEDIQNRQVDAFVIGSDWTGKFDYLNEYCEVVYLERTKGISSTDLRARQNGIIRLGVAGYGRIANRFIPESKYVSGINVEGVFGRDESAADSFIKTHELNFAETNYAAFLNRVDAVYIATPHLTHVDYARKALEEKKHVLCEKPIALTAKETKDLYNLAKKQGCVFLEAIKTAYAPGFLRMISIAKSGVIGQVRNIDATFTKLVGGDVRELKKETGGGSITELASYPLLAIIKLLGEDYISINHFSVMDENHGVDVFTKISMEYKNAIATAKVGLGVKSEGDLIVSGTKGYLYVPAPWWKTDYFETRFEDPSQNNKYYFRFDGEGLRYELAEFVRIIQNGKTETYKLRMGDSVAISSVIEKLLAEQERKQA
ncbi:Gfo/Idh/MocA family oxidoreductase [Anoxynatronum buryatiense]|uniref:Choline-phosphate cytidylyltransferase n=1 Tax=Anoxynatronum buryatiense TaxID=489973 RepID=A0AA45WZD7_9CLOT|nr:Gfo/Idh/MocA family oxidoreductase [Anoxynatronum buryatiense]SMP67510.1 choline-phosphate cytidylyltransferase [Anoxynatronum buryatiense]